MNELEVTELQTPIEIALGIDENGMTTARKLYEFLELDSRNYSRWCKSNITEKEFSEENVDYWAFVINEEWGGQATTDYKLTAQFAKKLSMKGNGEKAERAREYFTKIEEKTKQAVIDRSQLPPQLQLMNMLVENINRQVLEQQRQAEKLNHVEERVESIREIVAIDSTSWRDDTGTILRKIGMELGGGKAYSEVRSESYELLSKRMGVNLKQRLTNKRRRMADEGICKSARDKLTYVDIIAEDKKLIEGYVAIVKEMAIKYGIDNSDSQKGSENVSEQEKKVVEKLKNVIPKMNDFQKGYVLGMVVGSASV